MSSKTLLLDRQICEVRTKRFPQSQFELGFSRNDMDYLTLNIGGNGFIVVNALVWMLEYLRKRSTPLQLLDTARMGCFLGR